LTVVESAFPSVPVRCGCVTWSGGGSRSRRRAWERGSGAPWERRCPAAAGCRPRRRDGRRPWPLRPPRRFSGALRRGRAAPNAQESAEWMHFYVAVLPTGEITGYRDDASEVSDDVRTSLGFVSASGDPPALEDAPSSFTAGDKIVTVDVNVAVGARHPLVTGKGLSPAQRPARGARRRRPPTPNRRTAETVQALIAARAAAQARGGWERSTARRNCRRGASSATLRPRRRGRAWRTRRCSAAQRLSAPQP